MQKDWARTVPVGVEKTKQILEIHRRQIRRTECGEESGRKLRFLEMRTGWMLGGAVNDTGTQERNRLGRPRGLPSF